MKPAWLALGAAVAAGVFYRARLRRPIMTWGATASEADRALPGDADRVLPQFQHPAVGDTIAFGSTHMRLERVEPGRVLAWRSEDGNWVWTFVLSDRHGTTRLISRNQFRLPTLAARIGMVPMEAVSLVMERKMLLGIKEQAERLAGSS